MNQQKLIAIFQKINPLLKKYRLPILVLFTGILLLVLTPHSPPLPEQEPEMDLGTQDVNANAFDLESFEQHLAENLSQIEGVGRVNLTLSLKSTEEAVYAVNIRQSQQNEASSSYESEVSIVSGNTQGQHPILVKNLYPTFRGALVLCDGADSDSVQLAVTQAVSAVCGIGADKVSVLKMQN